MYRFKSKRLTAVAVAACCLVMGCGKEAEWEAKRGNLVLHATPLPPESGMPLTLALIAANAGPVSVYQGDALVATFANTPLDGKTSFVVTAVSSEVPRAESVGYDYEPIVAEATAFDSKPGPTGNAGGSSGTGGSGSGTATENCPGVTETPDACSMPTPSSVQLEVINESGEPISLYRRDPLPSGCFNQVVALLAPGTRRQVQQVAGNVMLIVRDQTNEALRTVTLPAVAQCQLVIPPPT